MGYIGNRYSERAADCYTSDILPMSYWTKAYLLNELESEYDLVEIRKIKLSKVPLEVLKNVFLVYDSWHHTGEYFKETSFYRLIEIEDAEDIDRIYENLKSEIEERKKNRKKKTAPKIEPMVKVRYQWIEWKGTRKYPKPYEYTDYGIQIGNWIYGYDSEAHFKKKNINSNGTIILKTYPRAPRGLGSYFKDIENQIPKSKKQKGGK